MVANPTCVPQEISQRQRSLHTEGRILQVSLKDSPSKRISESWNDANGYLTIGFRSAHNRGGRWRVLDGCVLKVQVRCSHCGASYSVAEQKLGQTGKCKKCGNRFALAAAEVSTGGAGETVDAPRKRPDGSRRRLGERSIPKRLAEVIDAALVEKPQIGFQSARDFRGALQEVL